MSVQILTGTHVAGSGAGIAGRSVKATPLPGQHVDATTVDTAAVVTTAQTDINGAWELTLLCGVVYDIRIDKWGVRTIRTTTDALKEFITYLDDNAVLAGPILGSIKVGDRYIRPTLSDPDADGNQTLGWEIV